MPFFRKMKKSPIADSDPVSALEAIVFKMGGGDGAGAWIHVPDY